MPQDLRFAIRQLLKHPGFSVVAVLTLALAIGANTAIFSGIDAVLLHPLPYPEPDRLVFVGEDLKHFNLTKIPASPPEVNDYRNMAKSFTSVGAFETSKTFTLTGAGNPEIVPGMSITASIFTMLGVKPIAGGLFTEVSPADPWIFGAVTIGLILVSLAAMAVPARRASRVNALEVLRHE